MRVWSERKQSTVSDIGCCQNNWLSVGAAGQFGKTFVLSPLREVEFLHSRTYVGSPAALNLHVQFTDSVLGLAASCQMVLRAVAALWRRFVVGRQ
jgi:hypothetical protein